MGIDLKAFMQENFTPSTMDVKIVNANLRQFFNGSSTWKIRGLTGKEVARTQAAAEKYQNYAQIAEALFAGTKSEKIKAFKDVIDLGGGTPPDYAKRVETLLIGSVDPLLEDLQNKVSEVEFIIKFSQHFAIEFYDITNRILKLTGSGSIPGKLKASGMTTELGQV